MALCINGIPCSLRDFWEGKVPLEKAWETERKASAHDEKKELLNIYRNFQELKANALKSADYLALASQLIRQYAKIYTHYDLERELTQAKRPFNPNRIKNFKTSLSKLKPSAYKPGRDMENMAKMYAISMFEISTSVEKCMRIFIDLHDRKDVDFVQLKFASKENEKHHCVLLFGMTSSLTDCLKTRVSKSPDLSSLFNRLHTCVRFKEVVLFDPEFSLAFNLKDKPKRDQFVALLNKQGFDNVNEITSRISKYQKVRSIGKEIHQEASIKNNLDLTDFV